jgi:hypothetical protein
MRNAIPCLLAGLFFLSGQSSIAQTPASSTRLSPGIGQIVAAVDTFNRQLPEEKLFLHFDKPYYAVGDTIWFKVYLFGGSTNAYSPWSGLLYVELKNDSDQQVKRISVPVRFGLSWGQFALDENAFPPGSYSIRAYTRWMENFGEEAFFHRRLFIAPPSLPELLARQRPSGRKAHSSDLPASSADPASSANHTSSPNSTHIGPIDLQFMPEGGWLVAGLPSRVGFKATGEDGLGRDIKGMILDSKDDTIVPLRSLYKGMGIFELRPQPGERYIASIEFPDGSTRHFPLPAVRKSGFVIRVENHRGVDSLRISVLISPDRIDGKSFHLIGLSRGVVCFGANMRLSRPEEDGIVPKSAFPSGIAHFTLFDDTGEPVCERLTYIDHRDELNIQLATDKESYFTRDSIPLHVRVTTSQGQPVAGSFSLAVTDDGQVRTDNSVAGNIVSHMLLTSGLKGYVETPAWYLTTRTEENWQALDALLLTQGWTGYHWKDILQGHRQPIYAAEPEFRITGKVTNLVNGPVNNAKVTLIGTGRAQLAMDTVTGTDGRFVFYNFPPMDSTGFVIQARNANGKSFGIDVTMDELKPPALTVAPGPSILNWDDLDRDSVFLRYVKDNGSIQNGKDSYGGRYKTLQKVVVRANPVIRGSNNLNGAGQADQVIDEATIEKAGKTSLKAMLLQTVKGFRIAYSKTGIEQYMIFQNNLQIVIDGLRLSRFGAGQERETLEFLTAEDIVGIEVMYNPRNTARYNSTLVGGGNLKGMGGMGRQYAFLEITTRSGNGIFMKKSPGVTTFRPIPVSWPQVFYSPRYPVKQDGAGANGRPEDLRATIHWQPSVITDKAGQTTTSFYSADRPSTYTIIIQGSDMDGNIGFGVKQISITR